MKLAVLLFCKYIGLTTFYCSTTSTVGIALFFLYKNFALQIVIYIMQIVIYISVNKSSTLRFIRTKYDNKYPTYLLVTHVFLVIIIRGTSTSLVFARTSTEIYRVILYVVIVLELYIRSMIYEIRLNQRYILHFVLRYNVARQ